jgi:Rrf2 family protein
MPIMVHLPRQVEYALMVLAEMYGGAPDRLFAVRALSTDLGIPFDVTAKAMQGMNRAGILSSTQGKQGGYRINRDLEKVSLDDLIEAVGAPPALTACLLHGGKCSYQDRCSIRTSIARLDRRVRTLFKEVTVRELIQ